jgi:GGDEF domain-containing protein
MREIMDSELEPALGHASNPSTAEVRGWMEHEFEQAQRDRTPAALLRVRVEGFDRLAPRPERRRTVLTTVLDLLRDSPRAGDLLACREGDDLIVLLPGTAPEAAELIARQSIERARKLALPGSETPQRASLCIGLAHVQSDLDLYFETLLQVAEEGLVVASSSGGERFVHTQLYGLFQRQVERARGPRAARPAGPLKPLALAPQPAIAAKNGTTVTAPPSSPPIEKPALNGAAPAVHAAPAADGGAEHAPELNGAAPAVNGVEPVASVAADALFEARIKSVFAADTRGANPSAEIERRVLELSRAWAQDALAQMLKRVEERHQSEIDLYERRIQKLAQALDATEEDLRRIANLKAIDPGVASAYRSVQGLDRNESQYAAKLSLLSKLLQANLELRAQLGGAAPAT